jgi:predicted Zn-dependent protease
MEHRCPEDKHDKEKLLAIFENEFIASLKRVNLEKPAKEADANPASSTKEQPHGKGQIHLVSIGEVPGIDVEELANRLGRKYGVKIKVLPKLPLTDEVRAPNFPNSRPVASRLIEFMADKYTKVSQNPDAIMIGITEDMKVERGDYRIYDFSQDLNGRFAVIATESMNPSTFCEPANKDLLATRLRKVVARMIGTLYFHLPESDNPQSVLYSRIGCVDELDYQGEDF